MSWALGINNLGQVVGASDTASGERHAFRWTLEGGMQDLGTLGGALSEAYAVNDAGHVVGYSRTAVGDRAFLWTPGDGMRELDNGDGTRSWAFAINNAGQVAGASHFPDLAFNEYHACLWTLTDADGDGVLDDVDVCPVEPGMAPYGCPCHSCDYNPADWAINLSELLRLIQFYNSGGYSCDPQGEDGYAPGLSDRTCLPHASDYNPQDWKINLSELLRAIQFYNSGGYHPDPATEDGFAPGL